MFLYKEDLFFVDNTSDSSSKVQIKDIRNKTFVMVPDSCGLSDITRSLLRTTRSEAKEYEGKALSYQVLADWASNGLGAAILPKSKILPHIQKQQVFTSNKPVRISFQAKWLSEDNRSLKDMIQHFKKNAKEIAKGIAE
jgi:DNA-binding transcriptional LysR family regulator